jgi:hypothetical protein
LLISSRKPREIHEKEFRPGRVGVVAVLADRYDNNGIWSNANEEPGLLWGSETSINKS